MIIKKEISLLPYNTFHIDVKAGRFCEVSTKEELGEALQWLRREKMPDLLVLGGGSNILLTRNVGYVLAVRMEGFDVLEETGENVIVRAGAGMNWHQFVLACIGKGFGGVENLSLIPGNVGASPMQNIGAYGVEIKDVFHELTAMDINTGETVVMNARDCEFGYRESVFKSKFKGRFVITSVSYRLSKSPVLNTSYGAIEQELERMKVTSPSIADVSQAVINIRKSKLPDPAVIGNAGSFFKNPEIPLSRHNQLKEFFPGMPGFIVSSDSVKVPAAWLIENCGWKGFRRGDAGCHELQALVLVNYGNATGKEIVDLSAEIMQSVQEKFGITLHREVNIV